MSTSRRSYGTGMRCRSAYLGWVELLAAAGQLGRRVKTVMSAGGQEKQIEQETKRFQANNSCWNMGDDNKFNYLNHFKEVVSIQLTPSSNKL